MDIADTEAIASDSQKCLCWAPLLQAIEWFFSVYHLHTQLYTHTHTYNLIYQANGRQSGSNTFI